MNLTLNWRKGVMIGIITLLVVDIGLALWIGKKWNPSVGLLDYFTAIVDALTAWTGRLVWAIGALLGLVIAIRRGKPPHFLKRELVVRLLTSVVPRVLRKTSVSLSILGLLVTVAPILVFLLLADLSTLPPGSSVLSTVDIVKDRKEIYVAIERQAEKQGQVLVFGVDSLQMTRDVVAIGDQFTPGKPLRIAIAPEQGVNGEVYVVDAGAGKVIIIDRLTHAILGDIGVGKAPRWIVVTPDQRKAYVSNEQPAPQGTISVIDLKKRKVIATIDKVNCPEGLAMSPNGKRMYVVTQCGAGQDPVFIVDTAKDKVVGSIPGMATGLSAVITPDGEKLYVARGAFNTRDEKTGTIVLVPAQVSVIALADHRVQKNLELSATVLAVTHDGRYVLTGGDKRIDIIETKSDTVVNSIPLATSPTGIAITKDERAYVWLPEENRLFLLGLSGLLPSATKRSELFFRGKRFAIAPRDPNHL